MSEKVSFNTGCAKLFQPWPWVSEENKQGYFHALDTYQSIHQDYGRDLKKLQFAKKVLNWRRISHWKNVFKKNLSEGEREYSRGYVMGMAAVRVYGIFYKDNFDPSDFYSRCLTAIESGKLKVEEIRKLGK